MISRLRYQRSIAAIVGMTLLAYALLVPMAEAKLTGMRHGEPLLPADTGQCHAMAGDETSTHDSQTSTCCQFGRCLCVVHSATLALLGTTLTHLVPVRDLVRSLVSSPRPSTVVELPLRPPDAYLGA